MNPTKSVSFRQPLDEYERLVARATECGKKPAVLIAEIVTEWLTNGTVPMATAIAESGPTTLSQQESERLETLVCRAVWTVIVALSPTLDEAQAEQVVNHFLKPANTNWMSN